MTYDEIVVFRGNDTPNNLREEHAAFAQGILSASTQEPLDAALGDRFTQYRKHMYRWL